MADEKVRYLAFDIASATDGALVARLQYPGENLDPPTAVRRYRDELREKHNTDFIPYTFQIPIAVAVAKIAADYRIIDVVLLDEPRLRPHVITEHFWRGWERYHRPTLVSFNGRSFDLPLMELATFRYGVSAPGWFNVAAKSFEQSRNRFNLEAHIDLQELLTNFGCTRFTGGLSLAANLLGKAGKMDVQGHMIQQMYEENRLAEVGDYCRCDLLDAYFVFLRTRVMFGHLTLDDEHALVQHTKDWLEQGSSEVRAYRLYLDRWGDWPNPRA